MSIIFFLLFSCQEKETSKMQEPARVVEEAHKESIPVPIPPQESEPLVFSPIDPEEPLILSIDTRKVNVKISQAFLSQEAQSALATPLQKFLSGPVLIEVSAPIRPGTDKPKIVIRLSRDQFLSLASLQSGLIDTRVLIGVFQALNQYRLHGGNYSDLRIFHFQIALDVGPCRFFPAHQDAFSPIESLDVCVEVDGEKQCGKKLGGGQMIIPKSCIQSP